MDNQKEIFSAQDIADICGLDRKTIRKWMDDGELKSFELPSGEINKHRRVRRADLIAFLEAKNLPMGTLGKPANRTRAAGHVK